MFLDEKSSSAAGMHKEIVQAGNVTGRFFLILEISDT